MEGEFAPLEVSKLMRLYKKNVIISLIGGRMGEDKGISVIKERLDRD